jgi:peptidoglycan hydrolase FlgJ
MNQLDTQSLTAGIVAAKSGQVSSNQSQGKIREAADQFEAMFLAQVLNSMTSGLEVDGLFGGGPAENIYRSMMNDQYAKSISRQGGVGIADVVYREMLALQEVE